MPDRYWSSYMDAELFDPRTAFAELGRIMLGVQDLNQTLQRIADLARRTIPEIDEVSVTLVDGGQPKTVVFTGQLAVCLDERQYETANGPHHVSGAVRRRVYLSGDTLTGEHLDEIRERHPEIDTAVVHLGGTRLLFWTVTMDANQGVDFLRRIRPRLAVPVHYDDYRVFLSPLSEFLSAMKGDLPGQLLKAPARGETVPLGER
jgi:L-ascorbate metabolism protein UlaG (beta-lactamase superfamily)